jgi:hypothetical protein
MDFSMQEAYLLNFPTYIPGSLGLIGNESIFELPPYAMIDEENRGVDWMDNIAGASLLLYGNDILNYNLEDTSHNLIQDQGGHISMDPRIFGIAD